MVDGERPKRAVHLLPVVVVELVSEGVFKVLEDDEVDLERETLSGVRAGTLRPWSSRLAGNGGNGGRITS